MAKVHKILAKLQARDQASPVFRKVGGAVKLLGAVAAAVGTVQIGRYLVRGLQEATKAAAEQERIDAQLAQSIRNVGLSVTKQLPKMKAQANALQQVSGVANETIQSGQSLLVAMGRLSGEGLERATKAALDLAAANDRLGVGASFDLIAKAATGYTSTLSRYGIILDESIPKQEKFAAALEFIEKRFGGSAAAQIETVSGQTKLLGENWADFLKTIGQVLAQSGPLREFLRGLNEALNSTAEYMSNLEGGGNALQFVIETLARGIGVVRTTFVVLENAGLALKLLYYDIAEGILELNLKALRSLKSVADAASKLPGNVGATGTLISRGLNKPLTETAQQLAGVKLGIEFLKTPTIEAAEEIKKIRAETDAWVASIRAAKGEMAAIGGGGATGPVAGAGGAAGGGGGTDFGLSVPAIDFGYGDSVVDFSRTLEQAVEPAKEVDDTIKDIGKSTQSVVAGPLSSLTSSLISGALEGQKNWGEFFVNMLKQFAAAIAQALVLKAIMSSIGGGGFGFGFAQGGIVGMPHAKAAGGLMVPGYAPGRDTVPAMLSPGETVLPPRLTDLLMRAAYGEGGGGGTEIHLHGDTAQLVTRIDKVVRSGRARLAASDTTSPTRTRR